ncbi:hypothetical protein [Streptomyces sp. NPDC057257]|uniref:hypothetical protein n=1 Tax=Streptomyces sp. NPDC057257 TaxID=3346071 RepID=UPI0036336942
MTASDIRAVVSAALSTVQGTTHHLGLVTLQVLTDRVTEAVAPLTQHTNEAYPGELAMLSGLVATLHAVAEHGDLADVRKLLAEHKRDEQDAYAEAEKRHPAGAEATPQNASNTPQWPADWDHVLDTAIRTWGGEWTTKRVQRLFAVRYGGGIFRDAARQCLSQRAHAGLLRLHHRPNDRFYTLKRGA